MARLKSSLSMRINRFGVRMVRSALLRFARRAPRPADLERADQRVDEVLWTAFGMGGTIRAAIDLAEYLAPARLRTSRSSAACASASARSSATSPPA